MAGWHCLSGYLYQKPSGPFSLIRSKKKQWYIFEESQNRLLYYKSENEARSSKNCLGAIPIEGAAISLNLKEDNEFIINTDSKEFHLQAENHESMMIWMLGLQAKRNALANKSNGKDDDPETPSSVKKRRGSEPIVQHRQPDRIQRAGSTKSRCDIQQLRFGSADAQKRGGGGFVRNHFITPTDSVDQFFDGDTTPKAFARSCYTLERRRLGSAGNYNDTLSSVGSENTNSVIAEEEDDDEHSCSTLGGACHKVPGSLHHFNSIRCSKSSYASLDHRRPKNDKKFEDLNLAISQSFTPGFPKARNENSDSDVEEVFNYDTLVDKNSMRMTSSMMAFTPSNQSRQSTESSNQMGDISEVEQNEFSQTPVQQKTSIDSGIPKEAVIESLSDDSVIEKEIDVKSKVKELENELLEVKRDLAQSVNRESCLREMLEKRDRTIDELDEKATRLEQIERVLLHKDKRSLNETLLRTTVQLKTLQEQCRVFQNQNRFLNEEVKKLTEFRQQEKEHFIRQKEHISNLNMEIERWKRDYVFLLQSNITVPTGDVTDGFELNLYGGDRHKERLQELLTEARETNPGLPTFDKLFQSKSHVDQYGFKHTHDNESLLMHYICCQMNDHYTKNLASYEAHQVHWRNFLASEKICLSRTKELRPLCRAGIPTQHRCEVWRALIRERTAKIRNNRGKYYYNNISNQIQESEAAAAHRKQISLDLLRTLPTNVNFDHLEADGIKKLQEILQAFTIHNPQIGYCQGMNFIAGMALLFLDKEDAFWCLVAFTEVYFPEKYFNSNLIGAQADQLVLKDLIKEKLPQLQKHLDTIDIDISTITLNWFLAVFFDAVPFETLVRIWDCFLLEGPKVLFRFSVAILKIHERVLLQQTDTISIWKHLKLAAKLTFDIEGLTKIAFEELKPFAKTKEISQRQNFCLKKLMEKESKRQQNRRFFEESEEKLTSNINNNKPVIECSTGLDNGKLWICHGEQNSARISMINCNNNRMQCLSCEFDSRILCIEALSVDIILLGSLAKNLYAFDTVSEEKLWQVRLHDTILDLCVYFGDDSKQNKVFAALGDGSLAVLENVSENEPMGNIFYISIGYSPLSSLLLVNQELWCACGNMVQIMHAGNLDFKDAFVVSNYPFDHILTLQQGMHGIWIAVKGSSILELWDERSLTCRLLYDVKEHKYPKSKRDDDQVFNPQRITSLLPYHNTIWVGSGNGEVTVFEVTDLPGFTIPFIRSNSALNSVGRHFSRQFFNSESKRKVSSSNFFCSKDDFDENTPIVTANSSPRKQIEKISRATQTLHSQIERRLVMNNKQRSSDPDIQTAAMIDNTNVSDKLLALDFANKSPEGLHLEIILQLHDDISPPFTEEKGVMTETVSFAEDNLNTTSSTDETEPEALHDAILNRENSTDPIVPDELELDGSELSGHILTLSDGSPVEAKNSMDGANRETANSNRNKSISKEDDASAIHSEGSLKATASSTDLNSSADEDDGISESEIVSLPKRKIKEKSHPSSNANFVVLDDELDDTGALYGLELKLIVRYKVAESPIRCLNQSLCGREYVIVSCASSYTEEEPVLKWKKCPNEETLWTNEPIYKYCNQTKQVQLPQYMKNRLSLSAAEIAPATQKLINNLTERKL